MKRLPRVSAEGVVAGRLLAAPSDLEVYSFTVGTDEYAVVTFGCQVGPRSSALGVEVLTSSERTVVNLVLRGWSNARIAAARGTSARTVANQLSAAYRKLRVKSRRELLARDGQSGAS